MIDKIMMLRRGKKIFNEKKAGFLTDNLGWIIFAAIVLVLLMTFLSILFKKDFGVVEYIKNLFRFGG